MFGVLRIRGDEQWNFMQFLSALSGVKPLIFTVACLSLFGKRRSKIDRGRAW